ncbi:MAG: hypothetical protein QG555_1475 [Thermodesulfobacteriota bacterium]|nr:hypothetical protein [Thermodesulfobacteriota bacterium]
MDREAASAAETVPQANEMHRDYGDDDTGNVEPPGIQSEGDEQGGIFDHGVVDADGKVEHLEILLGEVLRLGFLDDYRPP